MMEKLFSKEELSKIISEAELNIQQYLGGLYIYGEATAITIFSISKGKQLIFVEGNDDTGYNHLRNRHSYFSFNNYWKADQNGTLKLDDPSKFHPKMMPIVHFTDIADKVFCDENKNITLNNRPGIFDKYTGLYQFENEEPEKYHLITYKDTKIVHTLFPNKKKHNRKNKIRYGKGIVTTELRFPDAVSDLIVPYENSLGVIKFSILIRKFYNEKTERTFVQAHDEIGNVKDVYLLGQRSFENFERFEMDEMLKFQHGNLYDFEYIIHKIDLEINIPK